MFLSSIDQTHALSAMWQFLLMTACRSIIRGMVLWVEDGQKAWQMAWSALLEPRHNIRTMWGFLKRHLLSEKGRCYQSKDYKSSASFLCYFLSKITTLIILVGGSEVRTVEDRKLYRLKLWNMIMTGNVGMVTLPGFTECTAHGSVAVNCTEQWGHDRLLWHVWVKQLTSDV